MAKFKTEYDFTDPKKAYDYFLRNAQNTAHCIMENIENERETLNGDKYIINWGNVGSAQKVFTDLMVIAEFLNIKIKEV